MSADLTPEAIRASREAHGWSIAEAVRALRQTSNAALPDHNSLVRAWKRWEAGTAPSRFYQPLLTALLRHNPTSRVDISGDWWGAWETSADGRSYVAVQPITLAQRDDEIDWWAVARGVPVDEGGYLWRGELRLWDAEILMGWYAADDGSVRSKGVVYLALDAQGRRARGRWMGMSWDGYTMTGYGALARTEDDVRATMEKLRQEAKP